MLLTGDHENAAAFIAGKLGICDVTANCLPEDKLTAIASMQENGDSVCMIGDGINDVPALKKANIGIAMGGVGSELPLTQQILLLSMMRSRNFLTFWHFTSGW